MSGVKQKSTPTATSVKQLVDSKRFGKKVMVFSKSHCPYCKKAKSVLKRYINDKTLSRGDYEEMEIDGRRDCSAMQDYFRKITGRSSVPRVFINGKCIGGGDETQRLDGPELRRMLHE
ncbi:Glutaredoxin-2 [Mactra antiquata]